MPKQERVYVYEDMTIGMKQWVIKERAPKEVHDKLTSVAPYLRDLLYVRGVTTEEEAQRFLHPQYDRDLHDPFLILGMDKAVSRIISAIEKKEKIIIYADYDADGIPGSVVLHDFFRKIEYTNFEVYIPHRYKEGYGLNTGALDDLAKEGASLLITVDTGITNVSEVEYANNLGIDVIVTDHHLPLAELPPAYVILNPNQKDCTYPYQNLCGGGVAFKLVQALVKKGGFAVEDGWEKNVLDVASISTIADMVPLTGENRALAHFGLRILQMTKRPGIIQLFNQRKIPLSELTEDDIGFIIAPRINAASRIDVPQRAFEFLSTRNEEDALHIGKHLEKKNNERRRIVTKIIAHAKDIVGNEPQDDILVIGHDDWMPGVLGLAAHRLVEYYNRPTFVWGKGESDVVRGSVRSSGGVNIVDVMGNVKDGYFIDFGGHKFSGGFSLHPTNVGILEAVLKDAYEKTPQGASGDTVLSLDQEISLNDVTWQLYSDVQKLAPFGIENPKPVFLFSDIRIHKVIRFGNNRQYLKLLFKKENGSTIQAISFDAHSDIEERQLVDGNHIDLAATLERSVFRGIPELRLRIIGIRSAV